MLTRDFRQGEPARSTADRNAQDARRIWADCIATTNGRIAEMPFVCETSAERSEVLGKMPTLAISLATRNHELGFIVPVAALHEALESSGSSANLDRMEAEDRLLVVAQLLDEPVASLERFIGDDVEVSHVAPAEAADIALVQFVISLRTQGSRYPVGLAMTEELRNRVLSRMAPLAIAGEKDVDTKLKAMIGLVSFPNEGLGRLGPGKIVNCGVKPSDEIRGLLVRSDGKAWPIRIEDNAVEIAGDLAKPDFAKASAAGVALFGFALAEATLDPVTRAGLGKGDRIGVARHEGNGVEIFVNGESRGHGALTLVGETLGVRIAEIRLNGPENDE